VAPCVKVMLFWRPIIECGQQVSDRLVGVEAIDLLLCSCPNRPHCKSCLSVLSAHLSVYPIRFSRLINKRHRKTRIGVNVCHGRSNLCANF